MKTGLELERNLLDAVQAFRERYKKRPGQSLSDDEAVLALLFCLASIRGSLAGYISDELTVAEKRDVLEPFHRLQGAFEEILHGRESSLLAPRRIKAGARPKLSSWHEKMAIASAAVFLAGKGTEKTRARRVACQLMNEDVSKLDNYHKNLQAKLRKDVGFSYPVYIYQRIISGNWSAFTPDELIDGRKKPKGEKPSPDEVLKLLKWRVRSSKGL